MASPPAPRRPGFYVDPAELAALVRKARREKRAGEDLGAKLLAIAGGVWDRYRHTPDRDEFVQAVALHLLGRPLAAADPKLNLFAYFTTCAIRFGLKLRDRANAERRRFEGYAGDLVDAGAPLPTRAEVYGDRGRDGEAGT